MAKGPPVFELVRVGYTYPGGHVALRDFTMEIAVGESLVLLGANGSGKTTLLKILGGLIFAQTGVVRAFGVELTPAALAKEEFRREFRRLVGFLFQNPESQVFTASVWDEVAFGPVQLGLPPAAVSARVADCLRLVGLTGLENRPPHHLSGGEKKKLALAAVLAVNPVVLLLDEPTGGLDPRSQRFLVDLLRRLHRTGRTIVTATHNLDIVPEIAERVVVFAEDHGLLAEGAPLTILRDRDLLLEANLVHEHYHVHAHDGFDHGHCHCHQHGH